ncbi:MAG: DUF3307 domain-containing protein [Bacteroidota bacterium]
MCLTDLLILQFLAHLLADFTLQGERWATDKIEKGFTSKYLKWHIMIAFTLSWVLSFQWLFVFVSITIALFHWVIDGFKIKLTNHHSIGRYSFFIDQSLHLLVIIGFVLLFKYFVPATPAIILPVSTHWLFIITGYILCTKPANIFIKEVFKSFDITMATEGNLLNAGKLIGISERILTLTLILYGQFDAVGFIIAGKSIIRFKETDTAKTEYVLIGTLLSFGIAILTGIGIRMLK